MAATFRDYYETLNLPRTASAEEIKKAFRKLARLHHPDVAKDKKAGEIKFKEINEAYEVLSDPEKRKKYDQMGQNWDIPGAPPQGWPPPRGQSAGSPNFPGCVAAGHGGSQEFHFEGTGFSDFFEQFFGRSEGFGGMSGREGATPRPRSSGPRPGDDIEGAVSVTLEEVMHGSLRQISLQSTDPTTGQPKVETFKVRIPKGALEGQVIRIPGKGGAGSEGGASGHLFLRVRLAAHPDFRALGADLYHDLPLAPWEAVLGTTVRLHGLDGDLDVKIPPGTTNGQRLRLRGRGLPQPKSDERGALYVVVTIEIPRQVTPNEKQLWEELSRSSSFNPRGED